MLCRNCGLAQLLHYFIGQGIGFLLIFVVGRTNGKLRLNNGSLPSGEKRRPGILSAKKSLPAFPLKERSGSFYRRCRCFCFRCFGAVHLLAIIFSIFFSLFFYILPSSIYRPLLLAEFLADTVHQVGIPQTFVITGGGAERGIMNNIQYGGAIELVFSRKLLQGDGGVR